MVADCGITAERRPFPAMTTGRLLAKSESYKRSPELRIPDAKASSPAVARFRQLIRTAWHHRLPAEC